MPAIGLQAQGLARTCQGHAIVRRAAVPALNPSINRQWAASQRQLLVRAEPEVVPGAEIENPDSEAAQKRLQAEKLRAAEKFMVIGAGDATCKGCGYEYTPQKGDPEFPVPKGVTFEDLPADYVCPVCGAGKERFEARSKVVAGFAQNQGYGLGTNSMTGEQKLALIYGALGFFFLLFIGGYALE